MFQFKNGVMVDVEVFTCRMFKVSLAYLRHTTATKMMITTANMMEAIVPDTITAPTRKYITQKLNINVARNTISLRRDFPVALVLHKSRSHV